MTQSFSHIYLPSRDVDEAIAFYTQKLGFKLLRKYTTNGRLSAYVELGRILLELSTSTTTPSTDGRSELRIGLIVDDMDRTLTELRSTVLNQADYVRRLQPYLTPLNVLPLMRAAHAHEQPLIQAIP